MFNQYEVVDYFETNIPEIKDNLGKTAARSDINNVYVSIQCLCDFTFKNLDKHNLYMVKRCFSAAEKLYVKGNEMIKNAIENVYVFSFSRLLNACYDKEEKNKVRSIMPLCLYSSYMSQVLKSGL